jgi:hypothetical protein
VTCCADRPGRLEVEQGAQHAGGATPSTVLWWTLMTTATRPPASPCTTSTSQSDGAVQLLARELGHRSRQVPSGPRRRQVDRRHVRVDVDVGDVDPHGWCRRRQTGCSRRRNSGSRFEPLTQQLAHPDRRHPPGQVVGVEHDRPHHVHVHGGRLEVEKDASSPLMVCTGKRVED